MEPNGVHWSIAKCQISIDKERASIDPKIRSSSQLQAHIALRGDECCAIEVHQGGARGFHLAHILAQARARFNAQFKLVID